jgi:hypothetical protein
MNFMKELSLNDTVVIHENFSDTIFSITKEDKTCFALTVELEIKHACKLIQIYLKNRD